MGRPPTPESAVRGNVSIRNLLGLVLATTAAGALATPAGAQDLKRGKELFELCAQCHGPEGAGNEHFAAPSIAGLQSWYVKAQLDKFRDGARGKHPDDKNGLRMRPMSRFLRTEADVTDVAAYVESLPIPPVKPTLTSGDAKRGQSLYAPCSACHGPDASGNAALFAPALKHANDWYLVEQLNKFKAGIRGTSPKDRTGSLMRPMAMTLPNEQAVEDVVAYILTLSH